MSKVVGSIPLLDLRAGFVTARVFPPESPGIAKWSWFFALFCSQPSIFTGEKVLPCLLICFGFAYLGQHSKSFRVAEQLHLCSVKHLWLFNKHRRSRSENGHDRKGSRDTPQYTIPNHSNYAAKLETNGERNN